MNKVLKKEASIRQSGKTKQGPKRVYLEALRILAIVLILYQHQPAYDLYLAEKGPLWWVYTALSILTRMNVPLFFMISGAVLLEREESLGTLLRKRVLRFSLVILIFSAVYYGIFLLKGGAAGMSFGASLWQFVTGVLANTVEGSKELWFLYAYLGFLLMLPFMRRTAQHGKLSDLWFLLALRFLLYSLLPTLNFLLQGRLPAIRLSRDLNLPFIMLDAFFFPLLGYTLDHHIDVLKMKGGQLAAVLLLLVFAVLDPLVFTFIEGQRAGEITQNFMLKYDYLLAAAVFLLVKHLFLTKAGLKRPKLEKAVCLLGSLTFGIYLLDHLLKEVLWAPYYLNVEPLLPTILMSAGWILISFTVCGAVTFVLKKLPGVRKLI